MYMNSGKGLEKRITLGILAHVDAGKTTLSESLLYSCGAIRKLGRVDNRDAFLDTDNMEKQRGITIFSKQAELDFPNTRVTLLDTPGHVDLSAEMERTLAVLDYAVLVISGRDGVQGHTVTLWKLLAEYNVPTFIFVNKMDMDGAIKEVILDELREKLSENIAEISDYEQIALCESSLLDEYIETEVICDTSLAAAVKSRTYYPVFFGSALRQQGVQELINGIDCLSIGWGCDNAKDEAFGAIVYKITHDAKGDRLTHIKITSGSLSVRDEASDNGDKVSQIRLYSGEKYNTINTATQGMLVTVTGLSDTYAGQGLGVERDLPSSKLTPVLSYGLIYDSRVNTSEFLAKLRELEEDDPMLKINWDEASKSIQIMIMGDVQLEVMNRLIEDRTGVEVSFTEGSIAYMETIRKSVYGYGHYEPLRHYAEVCVRLDPLPQGSGIEFATEASEDDFDRNWQRLVMTHFAEKSHIGALAGFPITDVRIVLVDGRAHNKHTEGGDFRQATYRAIRQALRTAAANGDAVLLEPFYEFNLEVPSEMIGRAMTDIRRMSGENENPVTRPDGVSVLNGIAPVSEMRGYQREFASYTKGYGIISLRILGYRECHNTDEIVKRRSYDADRDILNSADSIFCSHGAGVNIPWDEVPSYAHLPRYDIEAQKVVAGEADSSRRKKEDSAADDADLKKIFEMTYGPEKEKKGGAAFVRPTARDVKPTKPFELIKEFILVDGYNVIFAWDELKALARENIDSAREALIEILCNYKGTIDSEIIVVFDAYRVRGGERKTIKQENVWVVYTGEAESADTYIEKTTFEIKKHRYRTRVVTSDVAEQIIIMSNNASAVAPMTFKKEIDAAEEKVRKWLDEYKMKQKLRTRNSIEFK